MEETPNLKLKKPQDSDVVDIQDLNDNADTIDAEVTSAKSSASAAATAASNAQTAINNHMGSGGSAHAAASTSSAGFMSAADKSKLNGIQAGAQQNTVTSVAGKTGAVSVTKSDVGLSNVDNVKQAPATRAINAGTGLSGGGNLSADRTLSVSRASQAQAEAGDSNEVVMTPQSTRQAIDANAESIRTDSQKPFGVEVVSSFPNSPFNGQVVYHSGEEKFFGYANGEWV